MPKIPPYSHAQQVYQEQLNGLDPSLREEILKDELCQREYLSPALEKLLRANRAPLPQYFLNSCEAAAINHYLFGALPTPASLLVCMRFILNDIDKSVSQLSLEQKKVRLFGFTGPTAEKYAKHRLENARKEMATILKDYERLEPFKVVARINRALQKLASMADPSDPSPLSKMPFRNWIGSFLAMLAPYIAESFAPGKPSILSRLRGAGFSEFRKLVNHCLSPANQMSEHLIAMTSQQLSSCIQAKSGAVAVVRNNPFFDHCIFVKSDPKSQKYLVVSDPKYAKFQRVPIEELAKRLV